MKEATGPDGKFMCPICISQSANSVNPHALRKTASIPRRAENTDGRSIQQSQPNISAREDSLAISNFSTPSTQQEESRPHCLVHPKNIQNFYCVDCELPVCKACCARIKHKHHCVRDLTSVVHELQQNTWQVKKHIDNELLQAMSLSITHKTTYRESLAKKVDALKELVEKQATAVIKLVDDLKARTMKELEQLADRADLTMDNSITEMLNQMHKLEKESELLSDCFTMSEKEVLETHRRLKIFFGKNRDRHFNAFYLQNKSIPDFDVMATLASADGLPKELVLSVKRHIGTAVKSPSATVEEFKRWQQYPLVQNTIKMQSFNHFSKQLKATKDLIMEWKHSMMQ